MKPNPKAIFGTFDTPEQLFAITDEAVEGGLYVDALNCTLSRADAIAQLLASACSDLEEGYSVNQSTIADGIWTLCGLIDQAKTITRNAG